MSVDTIACQHIVEFGAKERHPLLLFDRRQPFSELRSSGAGTSGCHGKKFVWLGMPDIQIQLVGEFNIFKIPSTVSLISELRSVTFLLVSNVAGDCVNRDFIKPQIQSSAHKCGESHSGSVILGLRVRGYQLGEEFPESACERQDR